MKAMAFFCAISCGQLFIQPQLLARAVSAVSFMPENDLGKYDTAETVNITEEEFEEVLKEVEAYYKPLIKNSHKADLKLVRDWDDPTVNAYATRYGSIWEVHMFGGLARRKEVTVDGFELVACHEIGHHLAGFPYVQSWASNEGQSDYFATLACAKHLWFEDLEKNAASAMVITEYPKKLCNSSFQEENDRNLCYRLVLAGKSLADLLSAGRAKFETPDQTVVSQTNNYHPIGQCRLDTYVAGALCKVEFDDERIPKSERDASKVSCLESRKQIGFRPKCWFKANR